MMNGLQEISRWLVAALATIAFAGGLVLAQRTGSGARVYAGSPRTLTESPIPVRAVDTSTELHQALLASSLRGRVLVSLSSFLHFVPVEGVIPQGLVSFPVPTFDLVENFGREVDHENVLWLALQGGVAREIVHVLPRDDYERRRSELGAGVADVILSSEAITTHELGSRRTLRFEVPRLREPVIIAIDASYMDEVDVSQALESLRGSGLKTDYVVTNLARDNPDVSDLGRRRLAVVADALAGGS